MQGDRFLEIGLGDSAARQMVNAAGGGTRSAAAG